MKEVGVVHKTKGSFAVVRFERKTACENCNMCLKPREEMYVELRLKNKLNAKVGDIVEVESPNGVYKIEITEINDKFIEEMRVNPKLCAHLHVSLQSGSERILKLMDRKYTKDEYEELLLS